MKGFKLIFIYGIIALMFSCNAGTKQNAESDSNMHKVKVEEVIDVTTYTYLRVTENNDEYWMAVPKMEVQNGATYYYTERVEMHDFESTELKRKFDLIYFVQELKNTPDVAMPHMESPHNEGSMHNMHSKHASTEALTEISIEPIDGGITIAELFANRENYDGQEVLMKGKVVKVNAQIMNKNWVHIQDGTEDKGKFDLTITTNDEVKVGDIVVFKGKITLNKDFGSGYSYEIIMEEAKLQ